MTYLLDVNALLALGFQAHEFHGRLTQWFNALPENAELAICAITELGFVRILAQAPQYLIDIPQSSALLKKLKANRLRPFRFLTDTLGVERLPSWVKGGRQLTDGHLLELAVENNAELATLDSGIPGAFLIPDQSSVQP